ncbi:protealysin inhibitor emfourin [Streptomyces atroolivaceus]|uniref:Protealysin inhibitor emfourin n=1 Tax=Streptomyces atroolivaceus TaxID=66869 RepID=A0ABV9V7S4_STRAZ|nr:protealysin inhibitor emfourin [Streptomyces atroolivaceus]
MRIQVSRTGGFAGIARHGEVETSGRPDAAGWEALAEAALATGRDGPPAGVPDGFRYRITVGDRTVECADPRLSEAQRTLISRVLKEGA